MLIGWLSQFLVIFGTLLLLLAIIPVGRLILQLPEGKTREWWRLLSVLIYAFVGGYIVYGVLHWDAYEQVTDLIVPVIFFFGAVFVVLVSSLSLHTAKDIKRIYTLEYESSTDSLLGIYNRRYLEKRLQEEFFRARRYNSPLSLMMIDVDHFKKINDRHGHPIGDLVLQRLAEMIAATARESDVIARYGGEEFLLILPHTKGEKASLLAERIRFVVENALLVEAEELEQGMTLQVTVSIGVAGLEKSMDDCQQLLKLADKALYIAKDRGRNRVISYREAGYDESQEQQLSA